MRAYQRVFYFACATGIAIAPLTMGCSKKKKGGSDSSSETASTSGSENTNVVLAGSLSLVGDDAAAASLNLTADPYKVYAVTFEDVPKACAAEIDAATGAFNKECADFAGVSFGAFLRQGTKTVGTIEFAVDSDSSTNMTTGGGTLSFNVAFDPKTGIAKAKVDVSKSDALAADKVAAAKAKKGSVATDIGDLTGTYKATCVSGKDGFECAGAGSGDGPSDEMSLYVKQWEHSGKKMLSIWDTKASHDKSFPNGGSEASPSFKLAISASKSVPIDVSSDAAFKASMDAAYAELPGNLKSKIKESAGDRNSWLEQQCEWEDQQSATFTDGNCRFVEAANETYSYFDFEKQQQITESHPKFYTLEEFAGLSDYSGTVTSANVPCDNDPATDTPWCPWNSKDGTFTQYKGASGGEMRLLCKGTEGTNEFLMQDPAMGETKAASLAARGGTRSTNCSTIALGGENLRQGLVNEIRQSIASLASSPDEGGDSGGGIPSDADHCSRYSVADGFTFNSCPDMSSGNVDWSKVPSVCSSIQWNAQRFGVEVDSSTGKLKASSSDHFDMDEMSAEQICPSAYAAWMAAHQNNWWDGNDYSTRNNSCRNELVGLLTAKAQADRISAMSKQHMDFKERIICFEGSEEEKTAVKSIEANSITPRARLERFWDEKTGTERVTLACDGAGSGPCVKDGIFLGRIAGRHVRGDLKAGVNGAFEVFESEQHSYQTYDPESKKSKECTNAHAFMMNARILTASTFESSLNSKETSSCTGEDSSSEGGSGSGSGSGSGGGDSGGSGDSKDGGGKGGFAMFFLFTKQ